MTWVNIKDEAIKRLDENFYTFLENDGLGVRSLIRSFETKQIKMKIPLKSKFIISGKTKYW